MPTRPVSTATPSIEKMVNGLCVRARPPSAPTTASGSDIRTASGRVTDPNSIIISMYISSTPIPSARPSSANDSPPFSPWPPYVTL